MKVLKQKLMPIAMPSPTKNDFKRIEKDFWEKKEYAKLHI